MTKDEFREKRQKWQSQLEDLVVDIQSFTNHQGLYAKPLQLKPVHDWFRGSLQAMEESFDINRVISTAKPEDQTEEETNVTT